VTAVKTSETEKDIANVEAWAEIIADVLWHVPQDKRLTVLALATKNEEAEAQERKAAGNRLVLIEPFNDETWMNEPGQRHWNTIMRLKSLLIQVFVRNITNNHSPQDAARLLFAEHRYGHGSGLLEDYLERLTAKVAVRFCRVETPLRNCVETKRARSTKTSPVQ
jgi:hypothetical protein